MFRYYIYWSILVLVIICCLSISVVYAGTLSCVVRSGACIGDEVVALRMSSTTNAHSELNNQTNYANLVCCGGVTLLSNSCSGNSAVLLKLSNSTNAHIEQNSYSNYANDACLSLPQSASVSIGYQADDCAGYDTTVASMSGGTNAHIGNPNAYATKVCATANNDAVISVSVSDGIITYGVLQANATDNTVNLSDTQTATNDGSHSETLNIKGQDATGGGCTWTLAGTTNSDQYTHEFSTDGGSGWTPLTANYQALAAGVASTTGQSFDLRLTTPTDSTCYGQQSANVTVQAVQE